MPAPHKHAGRRRRRKSAAPHSHLVIELVSIDGIGNVNDPVTTDSEPTGYLSDRWETVPECIDRYAYLSLEEVRAP